MRKATAFDIRVISVEDDSPLSSDEIMMAKDLIETAARLVGPKKLSDKHPAWLLCHRSCDRWITSAGEETRFFEGKWHGTCDISWDFMLPDGRRFNDPQYHELKNAVQNAAQAYRDGLVTTKVPALKTWVAFCNMMRGLAVWAVLHKNKYLPQRHGFALIDRSALNGLQTQLGLGGWTEAHQIVPRTLLAFYFGAFGDKCPQEFLSDPTSLPLSVRKGIVSWLESERAYGDRSKGLVSRAYIAEKIQCNKKSLAGASDKFIAFLRQFEESVIQDNGVLCTVGTSREFQTRRAPLLSEAATKPTTFGPAKALAMSLAHLSNLHAFYPSQLIPPSEIDVKELKRYGRASSMDPKPTAFIPFDIASKHVAEAVHWVLHYGDALVDYYLTIISETNRQIAPYACRESARRAKLPAILDAFPPPVELSAISSGFRILAGNKCSANHHASLRQSPTMQQALEILVGAIAVLIGILKPCRISEITKARRECLTLGDGYFLDTRLRKRTVGEYSADTGPKPIPDVVMKAVSQLQKLGNELVEIFDEQDPFQRNALFYLPSRLTGNGKVLEARILDRYMEMFVDYVGLPPDELGRRWYLRMHQLRRWFLLHLYWTGRSGAVDACVYMAGHTDALHILSYVSLECGGHHMESLEALYVMDQMHLSEEADEYDGGALSKLRSLVLQQFNVTSLDLVPARQFQLYLGELIESGQFIVTPSAIADEDGVIHAEVGFRFEPNSETRGSDEK
jgi:hypothetical protein